MANQKISVYKGNKPFAFISYSHKDPDKVLQIILKMQKKGFRIWYDAGIEVGTEWPERIGVHLKRCKVVIFFITNSYIMSDNCKREVVVSVGYELATINVYLEKDVVIPSDMKFDERDENTIQAWQEDDLDHIVDCICKNEILSECTDEIIKYDDNTIDLNIRPMFLKYIMRFGIIPSIPLLLISDYIRIIKGDNGINYWLLALPGILLLFASLFYYVDKFLRRTKKGYSIRKSIMWTLFAIIIVAFVISFSFFMVKLLI